jgi:O-methyltransferase
MLTKLARVITNPGKYASLLPAMLLERSCRLFQNHSFFLQGQMDIHPKARWPSDLVKTTGGLYPRTGRAGRHIYNLDAYDNTRRDMLILLLRTLLEQQVPGGLAELGVYRGLTARLIHHYLPERPLHLFDTFEGFTARGSQAELHNTGDRIPASQFSDTSLERVREFIRQQNDNVSYHHGFFPDSIPAALHAETFAFVHLDADLYEPTLEGLKFFYPRLPRRGILLVHDYNSWAGAHKAVEDFLAAKPEMAIPMPDKSGSAVIVKQ